MVTFAQVPANLRIPGIYVEIDGAPGLAGSGDQPYKAALIGQMLSSGTATANIPVRVTRAEDAAVLFGKGSMLYEMVAAAAANATFIDLWAIPMADPAGDAATGTITFAASSPKAGTINVYIGGRRIQITSSSSSTGATLATALVAAITADPLLPVTAAVNGTTVEQVDITAKHVGVVGNEIDVRVTHYADERLPDGVTATVVAMASGTGEPDLATALAALGSEHYNVLAVPYTSSALLTTLETELTSRFDATRQIDALAFTASRSNHSTVAALGAARNSPHVSLLSSYGSPSSPWQHAAAVAAHVTRDAPEDPARPFTTLILRGIVPPKAADLMTDQERNLLLFDGVSTTKVGPGGVVQIERLITTYGENALGAEDTSFLDVNSLLTVSRLRYDIRTLGSKYARFKVGDDGNRFGIGERVATPSTIKAEVIALYEEWVSRAWCENVDAFGASLLVERDLGDPNRINIRLQPDLVNQLRVLAARIEFKVAA